MLLKAGRTSFVATAIGFAVATAAALIALRTSTTPAALIQAHMVGLSYLVAGAIAWRRRPGNATGPLLVAIGSTWYVVDFKALPMPAAAALAFATRRIVNFLSTYLVLAYPSGLDVHRAARVGAAGHGGQTLLSEAARRVIAAGLPTEVTVSSLGAFTLKGLPGSEPISQLTAPDLPGTFPPLRLEALPPADSTP
jgi:hypothetical protein